MIAFAAPWLLLALIALPILWILLRAVPPAPIRRRFPGVALLLGLKDDESQADTTPWWLLLIRMLAVAAIIVGLAGPVLNPRDEGGSGPLLILADASWAGAADWPRRVQRIEAALDDAERAGRPVALAAVTDPPAEIAFVPASTARRLLPSLAPAPYAPTPAQIEATVAALDGQSAETLWIADGLDYESREALLEALPGPVTVSQGGRGTIVLLPPVIEDGTIALTVRRAVGGIAREVAVNARGPGPNGVERVLGTVTIDLKEGATEGSAALVLPAELRNRITRLELPGFRSAGAVQVADDGLRRREIALLGGTDDREGLALLSPTHFLRQALEPTADLIDGALSDILLANPDVIVLADVTTVPDPEGVAEWVENGGLLLRFAGPRLAASDAGRGIEDPLLPVRLRAGGRTIGGAMSWGEPKALMPFAEGSPFEGLPVPDEVRVSAQVLAEPDPVLAERTIAQLADGTPLVTRVRMGEGQIVLFHVTANADWSGLPLSGLFVAMLERMAVSTNAGMPSAEDLAGTVWTPDVLLDGFGAPEDAGTRPGVDGEVLASGVSPQTPPGLYRGTERTLALNVATAETELVPAAWPASVPVEGLGTEAEQPLGGWLLALALALLAADAVASLFLGGRLRRAGPTAAALLALAMTPIAADAQEGVPDDLARLAASEVVLAHVLTGDRQIDEIAEAGLRGISRVLFRRTSIEPAEPMGIDVEADELAVFPLLYWPVTADTQPPSREATAKLNRYLRGGGMIVFDTRDAGIRTGGTTPEQRALQRVAASLDIPPLEPVPSDHVLTRAFYLLQDFPGRHLSPSVWVEAAPPGAEQAEGMPFRNLNDNVTPVVIGGNDWAAAWAVDERGRWMLPVGRGVAGERQREIALRFGVNLVMHVLTGNYKSDQVHVPALLDRLGN